MNRSEHTEHANGLSCRCIRICCHKLDRWLNVFGHTLHAYGRSPVCVRIWFLYASAVRNFLPHSLHSNGFSPVCLRMWSCKCCLVFIPWPHVSHTNGIKSEWLMRMCVLRLPLCWKAFSQCGHLTVRLRPLCCSIKKNMMAYAKRY